jgi:hypothetical protein
MARGHVFKRAKFPVTVMFRKAGSLKGHSVEAHPHAAAPSSHPFSPLQQERANPRSAIVLGHPEVFYEQPAPVAEPIETNLHGASSVAANQP